MISQRCPNCGREHDVRVYVTGQRVLCACGIRFEVKRSVPSTVGARPTVGQMPAVQAVGSGVVPAPQEAIPTVLGGGVAPPSRPLMVDLDVSSATLVRGSQVAEAAEAGQDAGGNRTVVSRGKVELPGYELLELLLFKLGETTDDGGAFPEDERILLSAEIMLRGSA